MKDKPRSPRNKTLTLTAAEQATYSQKLLRTWSVLPANSTLLGDTIQVLTKLPQAFADLIILDPPYNLSKDFHGHKFTATDANGYLAYLESWFPAVVRCLKPNGSVYLCGDWRNTAELQRIMHNHLTVINRISWQREKGRGAKANWKNGMEDIWFGVMNEKEYYFNLDAVKVKRRVIAPYKVDGKPKDWQTSDEGNFRLTHPSNFWDDITIPYWSMAENTEHPTQKPEKLIAKLILASCPEGGLVFDPFLGSGTTSVVAKKLGRQYIGIEQNETYACWAEKRLAQADKDKRIQGYEDGVFWERNSQRIKKG